MGFDPKFYATQKMPTAQFVKQREALLAKGWSALVVAKDKAGTVTLLKKLPIAPTNTMGSANTVRKHASKPIPPRKTIPPGPKSIIVAPKTIMKRNGTPLTEAAKAAMVSLHPPPIPKRVQPPPARQTKAGSYTLATVPTPHTRLRTMPTDGRGAKKTPVPKEMLTAKQIAHAAAVRAAPKAA